MQHNARAPPRIPAPTAAEIERAKTDANAKACVRLQRLRVKRREEEIARWDAENADAGVYNLDDAFVPPPPPFPPPPLSAYNAYNTTIFFQGMFAFFWTAMMSFLTQPPPMLSLPTDDTQTLETQSLDPCPPAPQNTLGYDDVECAKSEWDMLSVAMAMYELSWVRCVLRCYMILSSRHKRCFFWNKYHFYHCAFYLPLSLSLSVSSFLLHIHTKL